MFQINTSFNTNKQFSLPLQKSPSYKSSLLKKDVFQSSQGISFKSLEGLFKKTPNLVPSVEIMPRVNNDFISRATVQISRFPSRWLRRFKDENYKIILSPTLVDAYKSQRVFAPNIIRFERENPLGTLGATCSEGKAGKNFFVFCDKPPYSDIYMRGIVNHELSHGVVNITGFDKSQTAHALIRKDVEQILNEHKLDGLSRDERLLVSHYFFNPNAYLPKDEIIADTYAWNKGGGCYGSGLVLDVNNPSLMKNLFTNLSDYLKSL